jgi:L-seryl-tRNA(Ser) seleniumtransferase
MEELLSTPGALEFSALLGREEVKIILAEVLNKIRQEVWDGMNLTQPISEIAAKRAEQLLRKKAARTLKSVVNATGVVIHTNLGRSPLAPEAIRAVHAVAGTYSSLEYDPETGARSERNNHVEGLICRITGAEAALAVNNNAAGVLLALSSLAAGREIIVSSGELVEIGGSFRIPDILAFSGAKMIAVGCTNSTRLEDYRRAISPNTAALLKVHPSNYRVEGFTASTTREDLADLADSRGLVLMEDLGSGLLCPLNLPFAKREHSVRDCLQGGSRIVTFSGDKLLGGPQVGVIAGSKDLIDRMRKHQLLRAFRVDKMTLAAFRATLLMYLTGKAGEIPTLKMLERDKKTLRKKAQYLCRLLRNVPAKASDCDFSVVETQDLVGGGAFPTDLLEGFGVRIRSLSLSPERLAGALRTASLPVLPEVRNGQVILHVRTLLEGDEKRIALSFEEIWENFQEPAIL